MIVWDVHLDAAMYRMREEGWSWERVADRLGVSPETVRRHARRLNMQMGRLNVGPIPGPLALGIQPTERALRRRKRNA